MQCVLQDQVSGDLRLEFSVTQSGQSQVSVHLEETVCEWGHSDLYWTVTDTASETADVEGEEAREERTEGEGEPQMEIRK